MSRKIYNKLIRDKIPEVIKSKGAIPQVSVLADEEYKRFLKMKMTEEAKELLEAQNRDEILNELSDIQELIQAIAKNNDITLDEIEKQREKKLQEKGGFEKKLFLEYVDE